MKVAINTTLLLLSLLLLTSCFSQFTLADGLSVFCNNKCKVRCSKAGVKDRCFKYCGICCVKCKCVPSGTYGNKHECRCYRDLKNSKGKSKCPKTSDCDHCEKPWLGK